MPTEDAFTQPHAECRHPHLWHSPDSDSTEEEVTELIGGLIRALQPEYVVETGSAFGYTTVQIAEALKFNGHGFVTSLEIDSERAKQARDRLETAHLSPWAEVLEIDSMMFVPPKWIGFAFFDSLYELRAAEFRRYHGLGTIRSGTIVAFHDTTSGLRGHHMDMRQEVESLWTEGLLRPIFLRTPRGIALCEVK